MKTRSLALTLFLVVFNIATGFCADPLSEAFRKGLYEEEANQNLQAAIEAYESVLKQLDAQRKIAAATVFRLGECYRKLGRTNDAVAQYQRISREFSDQDILASLSRQNLAGLGIRDDAVAPRRPDLLDLSLPDEESAEIARLQEVIRHSPDLINTPDTQAHDQTPLQSAARKGQLRVAEFLLEHQVEVNAVGKLDDTPLHLAAEAGHKTMVELLIKNGANVNARDSNDGTALHGSLARGFRAVSEVLISAEADVNADKRAGPPAFWGLGPAGTPLLYAIRRNDTAMVELLLSHGASPNYGSTEGITPLQVAAYVGDFEIVSMLLKKGASVNSQIPGPVTIRSGRDTQNTNKSPFGLQGQQNESCRGFSPLHFAALNGHPKIVELLIENGAEIDAKASRDRTPLNLAAVYGDPESVRLLLENGANPNSVDSLYSKSPLQAAIERNAGQIVQVVLRFKPNLESRDKGGYTALHHAVLSQNYAIVRELLTAGVNPNAVTPTGNTSLHIAVQARDKRLVEILLENKASVSAADSGGKTPMDYLQPDKGSPVRHPIGSGGVRTIPSRTTRTAPSSSGRVGHPPTEDVTPAAESEIYELLRKAGAEDDPSRSSQIRIGRDGNYYPVFYKGTNDINRYSALELIGTYIVNWRPPGPPARPGPPSGPKFAAEFPLRFPDFGSVVIHRSISGEESEMRADLESVLRDADCSADVQLEWGDIVEVPEKEHKLNETWNGFGDETWANLRKCLTRFVSISVKNQPTHVSIIPSSHAEEPSVNTIQERLVLLRAKSLSANPTASTQTSPQASPAATNEIAKSAQGLLQIQVENFRLEEVLLESNLLLTSSDLTRVKVIRTDPVTSEELEFVLNLEDADPKTDLWLLDGDKIEVPEK